MNEFNEFIFGSLNYYVGTYVSVQEHHIYFMARSNVNISMLKFVQSIRIFTMIMINNFINLLLVS